MRFIFVGDIHAKDKNPNARLDDYRSTVIRKLKWCVKKANELDCRLIFPGDIFDYWRPSVSLVLDIALALKDANKTPLTVIGNHDIYGYNPHVAKNCMIAILFNMGVLKHIGESPEVIDDVMFTGADYTAYVDVDGKGYLGVPKDRDIPYIHVAHGFLKTSAWIPEIPHTVIKDVNTNADIVLVGHDHLGFDIVTRSDGKIFVNPGALTRVSASMREIGRSVNVCFIDVSSDPKLNLIEVPHEPGEDVLSREHIEQSRQRAAMREQAIGTFASIVTDFSGSQFNEEAFTNQILSTCSPEVVELFRSVMSEVEANGEEL